MHKLSSSPIKILTMHGVSLSAFDNWPAFLSQCLAFSDMTNADKFCTTKTHLAMPSFEPGTFRLWRGTASTRPICTSLLEGEKLLIIKNYKKCGFRNRVIFSYAQWMILQKRGSKMKKKFNPNYPKNFFKSFYANLNVSSKIFWFYFANLNFFMTTFSRNFFSLFFSKQQFLTNLKKNPWIFQLFFKLKDFVKEKKLSNNLWKQFCRQICNYFSKKIKSN